MQSVHYINIIDFSKDKTSSGSTTPSNFVVESPCGDKEKSSGSTTTHSDYSLSDYEAFYFDEDHIEEKSSGSTTTHYDFSLPEFDSFIFDLSINLLPPADRREFTRVLKDNIFDFSTKGLTSIELNYSSLLLSDCDPSLSMEFFEIDPLVTFPSGNEDIVFDPGIISKESNLRDLKFH
ncbi:hypothetical protein Tco_1518714 [Tanacetum coccineum]